MAKTTPLIPFQFGSEGFTDNMEEITTSYPQEDIHSKHNPLSAKSKKQPNRISNTLWEAIKISKGYSDRRYFAGMDDTGSNYVELGDTDKAEDPQTTIAICRKTTNGVAIIAGSISGTAEKPVIKGGYKIRDRVSEGRNGTAVVLAMLPFILTDEEARNSYSKLSLYAGYEANATFWTKDDNLNDFSKELCLFTDNVYRRCNGDSSVVDSLQIESNTIKRPFVDCLNVDIKNVEYGAPEFFRKVSKEEILAALDLSLEGEYSEAEKEMIPVISETTIIPQLAIDVATNIKFSTEFSLEPFRVAGFFGPAGCGKTVLSKICAGLLQLPRVSMTMSEDTDEFALIGTLLPACATDDAPAKSVTFDDVRKELGLPSTEDCEFNTEMAYITVFKRPMPEGTESADVISEVEKRISDEIRIRLEKGDYKFIKSPLVQAIENGYLCEIQEIGAIRKQSVVMALNAWLETGENAFATLTTGQKIKRHPNCCIIFTSNDGYDGTRKVQLSVFDRYAEVYWLNSALPEVMADRAFNVTKGLFPKKEKLVEMANILKEITKYSNDRMIRDGIAGQRSLNNWATKCLILSKVTGREIDDDIIRQAMQSTVIAKISQNTEDIEDVVSGVVNKYFSGVSSSTLTVRQNMA